MSSQTKIVVLRMKTIIYTVIIIALIVFVFIMAWLMFGNKADKQTQQTAYRPGRYSATLTVNANPIDIVVTVDKNNIHNIEFYNLSESVTTDYPLMQPALENLTDQILELQTTSDLTYEDNMKYTQQVLVETINRALEKARSKN
jgi:uncharacterized protein with FMN-binding domain